MRYSYCFPLTIILFLMCGCGSIDRVDLSGDVTLDGKPLELGSILLTPLDMAKGTSTGGEIKNGKYMLTGKQAPKLGMYKVEIHANKKSGRKVQKAMGKPGELDDELVEAVAPRYSTKSELTVEVREGGRTKDFQVRSK